MESLAVAVSIILAIVMFSGPIGILLTINPIWQATLKVPTLWYMRRAFISVLAVTGTVMGFLVLFSGIPFFASILMISGVILNILAIKLEYQIGKFNRRGTPSTPGASEL